MSTNFLTASSAQKSGFRNKVQTFGRFLSGMVLPNIGVFIAWGLITTLFIPAGWVPNANLAKLVGPMITYLIPMLIGYTGGRTVGGARGGVVGALATIGVIVGSDIPMLLGAMIVGPLGGFVIKKFDESIQGKIKPGFEMLINTFSVGILGGGMTLLAFVAIGPAVLALSNVLRAGVQVIVNAGLLPFTSILIEPGKILFLNNAINHGILGPLGIQQATQAGKSIFFLLETNPGPGLGILCAYWAFSKGAIKQTAPGAIIIHFFGGIHEIYFPYVLMKPALLLAVILGGMSGVFTFSILGAGLVATPAPGSILALLMMTPKGGFLQTIAGVLVAAVVSFIVASFIIKNSKEFSEQELSDAKDAIKDLKGVPGKISVQSIKKIMVACDAGMGSSAMGATTLRNKIKNAGLNIQVSNCAIEDIPSDTDIVFTHESLSSRAKSAAPKAEHISIKNFVNSPEYDDLVKRLV